jgi:hypothetical protein
MNFEIGKYRTTTFTVVLSSVSAGKEDHTLRASENRVLKMLRRCTEC